MPLSAGRRAGRTRFVAHSPAAPRIDTRRHDAVIFDMDGVVTDSASIHAAVVRSDVADIQGGTTGEGIHLAAMAGSVDLLQRCFTGLEIRRDRLIFCHYWPKTMGTRSFPMMYRGHRLIVRVDGRRVEIGSEPGNAPPIEVVCRDRPVRLVPGETVRPVDRPPAQEPLRG